MLAPDILKIFQQEGLIAVLRAQSEEEGLWIGTQLAEAGVQVIEVTWSTPNPARLLQTLRERYPAILFGAGTIFNIAQAQEAQQAGASFLVSPVFSSELLAYGQQWQTLVIPGAMTPTEVYHAAEAGASVIKIFPTQQAGGPAYLKALLSVMPTLQLLPTGGIQREDVEPYLRHGALAVGVGQPLYPPQAVQDRNSEEIHARVRAYLKQLSLKRNQTEALQTS